MSALKIAVLLLCALCAAEASRGRFGVSSFQNAYCSFSVGYELIRPVRCSPPIKYSLYTATECCDYCKGYSDCRGYDFNDQNHRCYCAARYDGFQKHNMMTAGAIYDNYAN